MLLLLLKTELEKWQLSCFSLFIAVLFLSIIIRTFILGFRNFKLAKNKNQQGRINLIFNSPLIEEQELSDYHL